LGALDRRLRFAEFGTSERGDYEDGNQRGPICSATKRAAVSKRKRSMPTWIGTAQNCWLIMVAMRAEVVAFSKQIELALPALVRWIMTPRKARGKAVYSS
jgi:hypothetical protein